MPTPTSVVEEEEEGDEAMERTQLVPSVELTLKDPSMQCVIATKYVTYGYFLFPLSR